MSAEPVEAVIFDFGGVLSSPIAASFAFVQETAGIPLEALGRAMATVTERDGANPLHELECGRITEPEFMADLEAVISAEVGLPVAMHDFSEHYFRHLHTNEEIVGLVRSLRARGYRTALLTNNVREWEPRWRKMIPVDDLFELVVDSAFVGMRKPDPRIYTLTCERLGLPASRCLFLDDFEINCDAARRLGMRAVQFHDTTQAIDDIEAALLAAAER
jgi:putative hydrolase of the HAD superfamily